MAVTTGIWYKKIGRLFSQERGYVELAYDVTGGDSGAVADSVNIALFDEAVIITKLTAHVETAFGETGGTAALIVGITGNTNAFLASSGVSTLVDNYVVQTAEAQGLLVAADSYVIADPSSAALTGGKIVFKIEYVNAR